jgi:hypothetical protein
VTPGAAARSAGHAVPQQLDPDNASAQVANGKNGRSGIRRSKRKPSHTPRGTSGGSMADISSVSRQKIPMPT